MEINKNSNIEEMAKWNDEMVSKYHKDGILFESKNPILKNLEIMRLKKIIILSDLKTDDKILDLGCGEGFFLYLLPKNIQAKGVDISRVALERAKELLKDHPNTSVGFGNAYKTDFEDKSFDKIACSEVLEHVPEPEKVIKEIHRLLKDDGIAVISVPDEKRIKCIMRIIKLTRLDKFLHAARKQEDYDWHLHEADKKFINKITKDYFKIKKITRAPAILGYRFVVSLTKK